jgi:hypothetical protein
MKENVESATALPGLDFMQSWLKGAGSGTGLGAVGSWITPTLDPEELDKRIQELKTVQFWLDQNAKLLATTIQALEVQRMTLATLKGMNLSLAGVAEALQAKPAHNPVRAEPAPLVDPMQWWSTLTQQFTELAGQALQPRLSEAGAAAPKPAAGKAKPAAKPAAKAAVKPAAKRRPPRA